MSPAVLALLLAQNPWGQQGIQVRDAGVVQGYAKAINCVGPVACTSDGYVWTLDLSGAGGGGYSTIKDEGTSLTQRTTLNFSGSGVTCSDNAVSSRTDCAISGGSPAGSTYELQFNNTGAFSSYTGLSFNTGTLHLNVPGYIDATYDATVRKLSLTYGSGGTVLQMPTCGEQAWGGGTNWLGTRSTYSSCSDYVLQVGSGSVVALPSLNFDVRLQNSSSKILFKQATAYAPVVNFASGTAPASPASGDLWWDGTALNFRGASSTVNVIGGSGTGTCSANTWASAINAGTAPTCTQPDFTNLAGSIATGQIPSSTVTPAQISATGTPSSATYLRGDGSWGTPSGTTGTTNYVGVEINFGAGDSDAYATVTGQSWVTASSRIICSPTLHSTTSRNEGDADALIEGLQVSVHTKVAGVGFSIMAAPREGNAYGVFQLACVGGDGSLISAFAASVSDPVPYGSCNSAGTCTATTGSTTCSGANGSGSYTYAWSYVSGSIVTVTSPSSASTTFSSSGLGARASVYRCTATDTSSGATATANVSVQLENLGP